VCEVLVREILPLGSKPGDSAPSCAATNHRITAILGFNIDTGRSGGGRDARLAARGTVEPSAPAVNSVEPFVETNDDQND